MEHLQTIVEPWDPRTTYNRFTHIGRGSTCVVDIAYDQSTGHAVAVKKINLARQRKLVSCANEVGLHSLVYLLYFFLVNLIFIYFQGPHPETAEPSKHRSDALESHR